MNIHPGEILAEEFLTPLGISMSELARGLNVPPNRVTAIIKGDRSVSADTAHRLAAYFGTSAKFWLNLQNEYDLRVAQGLHSMEYEDIKGPSAGRAERDNDEENKVVSSGSAAASS